MQLSLNWEWPKFCRFPKWPNLPTPSYLPKIHIAGAAWRQKKRRKWCEWDSPNLRAGVSEACRHQNRMFFFHWLWRVPYLIVGLPDYHEYHVIKITEKCTNVVGHTWLSPVSHHQDNREICQCCCSYLKPVWQGRLSYYNSPCWSWELSGSASFAFFLLFVGIKILQKAIISTWTLEQTRCHYHLLMVECTVVNFLDFQLWQQTEPLETALQRG